MSEININHINARLNDLAKEVETIKAEKARIEDPTIKGLDKKFTEMSLLDAGSVIHLHNTMLERLESLTTKVALLESKVFLSK
jgi:tetrahydromethanopterin S-methyltransferase subunit G